MAEACHAFPLTSLVSQYRGYYALNADCNRLVDTRKEKEERAKQHWKIATLMASVIERFPFVRAVFVSGELSKGVASEQGDVDFVIITANNRLWICRTLLILFKKIVLFNSKKYFCLNHFISERNLVVNEQNIYTALELGTLKPLHNQQLFYAYIDANPWLFSFLPNYRPPNGATKRRHSRIQHLLELIFFEPYASKLDAWLLTFWIKIWKKRYPSLSDEKRAAIFRSTLDLSTAYYGDFAETILTKYQERLQQLGLYG